MKPRIDTLVSDIYKTLEKGAFEIDAKELADGIAGRFREEHQGGRLRMSNVGTPCKRKLWYTVNKSELAEPLQGHTLLKFMIGHVIEEIVLSLVKAAGHVIYGRQDKLEVGGIKGSRDAVIDGMVVDVKSANSRSYDKFKYHKLHNEDPFGYLDQLGLYHYASKNEEGVTNMKEAAFLAVDKELGHLCLDRYNKEEKDYERLIEEKKAMVARDLPPARGYRDVPDGKSGNMVVPMQCKYCPFKDTCWKDANGGAGLRKVVFSNGPRWFTKIIREPNPKTRPF